MNKISVLIQALLLLFIFSGHVRAEAPLIGMLIEKENTATYIETLEGLRDQLSESGKRYDFIERNARNNRNTMKTIAREFASDLNINAVVVMGSAAVSIVNQQVKNKPVIFGGVNHPGGLGVSGDNITGTTYYIAPSTVINLITKLSPDINKIGMLYEPAEQNAASTIEVPETEAALKERGIELVKETVMTKDEIVNKTKKLIESGVEYIIIPTNKLLYNNVTLIQSVSDVARVPIVSFSKKGVVNGALIAITSDNKTQGEKMAQILIDIVEQDKSPMQIKWEFPSKYTIFISERTRTNLNIKLPNKIYGIATILYTESTEGAAHK